MASSVANNSETFVESRNRPLDVVVHPIVLLSVVDHYARLAKGTSKRVIGTLLGEIRENKLHVLSSFAIPFEEDLRDPRIWFLDHNYHEQLAAMHKKVNAKETIVGWYSSGPKIKPADIQIHELFRKYVTEPVLIIMEVTGKETMPMEAYYAVQEKSHEVGFTRTFRSVPSTFGADEAEEVGTEHLLRDIRNSVTSTLAHRVKEKCTSEKAMIGKLSDIKEYLQLVREGKYPYNASIIDKLQDIFNEIPELFSNQDMVRHCQNELNDQYLAIYIGSILRSILALHNLVQNKIQSKKFLENEKEEKEQKKTPAKEPGSSTEVNTTQVGKGDIGKGDQKKASDKKK